MRKGTRISAIVAASGLAAAAAFASTAASAGDMEEIAVQAPRIVTIGRTAIGAPIDRVTIESRVGYGDLNLTTLTDDARLKQRVRDAARVACREAQVDVPLQGSSNAECTARAIERAMPKADAVIASARARDAARYG